LTQPRSAEEGGEDAQHRKVDRPRQTPASPLVVPVQAFAASAVAVGVVVTPAALYAQRSARRAKASEVLGLS
jgi:hypothetical protein